MKTIISLLTLLVVCFPANADNLERCKGLVPQNSPNTTQKFDGELNLLRGEFGLRIDKLFDTLIKIGPEGKAQYESTVKNNLADFPRADKLLGLQFIIYTACVNPESNLDLTEIFRIFMKETPDIDEVKPTTTNQIVSKSILPSNRHELVYFPSLQEVTDILDREGYLPPLYTLYPDAGDKNLVRINEPNKSRVEREDRIAACYSHKKCFVVVAQKHQLVGPFVDKNK